MKLTEQQMLAHWRRHRGLVPERSGCSIEVFDNIDLTARLHLEMRQWYLNLLDHGDLRHLMLHDVCGRLTLSGGKDGVYRLALPVDVRRLISLIVEGAEATPVTVATLEKSDARRDILNRNIFSRSGRHRPTAVADEDGRGVTLFCRDGRRPLVILSAMAVTDPGEETYEMDESALNLLYKHTDYE